jgi:hypothetical protein
MIEEEMIELFKRLSKEDQMIVIELLKSSLMLSTVDLYKLIEELESM